MIASGAPPQPDDATVESVARRVTDAPNAVLRDWKLEPMPRSATYTHAWRISGTIQDGQRPLSFAVVLKLCEGGAETHSEVLAYRSGFLESLRGKPYGIIAPRCFDVQQSASSATWLWLEDASEPSTNPWSLQRYGLAAYHLGRFNGAYPDQSARTLANGPERTEDLPEYSWLGQGFLPDWIGFLEEEGFGDAILGVTPESHQAWEDPIVRGVFAENTREHLRRIWSERGRFLATLNNLPRTLAHGDAHRRNLLHRPDASAPGGALTVGVDWDSIGFAPLGEDPGHLVSSSQLMEVCSEPEELDRMIFEGYLEGLGDAGWRLDERTRDLVRFGYAAHTPLNMGLLAGGGLLTQDWLRRWLEELPGQPLAEAAERLAALTGFTLALADEAEFLGRKLGLIAE